MRLCDCYMEPVAYVAYFLKTVSKRQPAFEQVKAQVESKMTRSFDEAKEAFGSESADLARFAVCAWIDEAILSSVWNNKSLWQRETLQFKYYQTAAAGEIFFDRLNALGAHQNDVREVFYLCLAMGFMGRYCKDEDKFLIEQLKTSNLKVLSGSSAGIPVLKKIQLFPEAYPVGGEQAPSPQKSTFGLINIILIAAPPALFAVLYFIYWFVLNNITKSMVQ